MDQFLSLTVGGLATAAIYAVAASGLVLTYTTTGTFNFAHGAIGMIAAFLYWQLHFDWGWPTPIALGAVLVVAGPLFGVAWERVVMRRLEGHVGDHSAGRHDRAAARPAGYRGVRVGAG